MEKRGRTAEALCRAAEKLGDSTQLAGFLGIDADELERWLSGVEAVPLWAYLAAFELITDVPAQA